MYIVHCSIICCVVFCLFPFLSFFTATLFLKLMRVEIGSTFFPSIFLHEIYIILWFKFLAILLWFHPFFTKTKWNCSTKRVKKKIHKFWFKWIFVEFGVCVSLKNPTSNIHSFRMMKWAHRTCTESVTHLFIYGLVWCGVVHSKICS